MRSFHLLATGVILVLGLLIPLVVGARSPGATIFLRRASFDPLQSVPAAVASADLAGSSTLRLAQLDGPPTAARIAALKGAGLYPLIYIPDNAFLVRADSGSAPQVSGLRWIGTLPDDYKLAPELAGVSDANPLELRVLATPDADVQAVTAAISAAGGGLISRYDTLNGATLMARLPGSALASLAARDDVLWIEQRMVPQLLNNTARALIGVDAARQELSWLTGAGQIVAVTDTGLDRSDSLSADFSGRIAATFTPQQMDSSCTTTDWSDHDGHGTHVSGSILGSGALSPAGVSFAGVAPGASLVVEAIASSSSAGSLDCLPSDDSFLQKAYSAGARVQNASWGSPTGRSSSFPFAYTYGGYTDFEAIVDDFLYRHPTHLLVVAAGNEGIDGNLDGVIDADTIGSPATAKNVLAVGATENNRPPTTGGCAIAAPENRCWSNYIHSSSPISSDFVSDNPAGMAAFSSRGPADDGRIKPDLSAPGTNVISSASHADGASYDDTYGANYAYESGTSMATPLVSGVAALVRQWLSQDRGLTDPSAALVRALLLNGASNLSPGQYGTGSAREIPAAWPNSVEGWGRVNLGESVQLSGAQIWLRDETGGLSSGTSIDYALVVTSGSPRLRTTLTWTDYPASPLASKTLVNDLDLEVLAPDGSIVWGNGSADLISTCRAQGADRCNTSESVDIAVAQLGTYTLRVTGASVTTSSQPFAIVARTSGGSVTTPPPTVYDQHAYLPLVGR